MESESKLIAPQAQTPALEMTDEVASDLLPAESSGEALPVSTNQKPDVHPATPSRDYALVKAELRAFGWQGYRRLWDVCWAGILFAWPLVSEWFRTQKRASLPHWWQRLLHRVVRWNHKRSKIGQEEQTARHAVWLRERLTRLGPTFIKIGQTLAVRPDLMPLAYIKELTLLQDAVPPFPNEQAWARMTEELGRKPNEVFHSVDSDPLAAASLGQVYRARLKDGADVVIKVQRPNLESIIRLDLAVMRYLAAILERHPEWVQGIDWMGVVDEFEQMIFQEIDYEREVRNAERFRANFATWQETVYVPKIYPEYSTARLIVMEYIGGYKVTDVENLKAAGNPPVEVVKLLTRTYLKQLLEDGFFHADPHPGNVRVLPDGRLAFFDFGMVGQITEEMRSGMIDAFFHIVERDIPGLVGAAIELGFLRPGFEPEEFKPVVEAIFAQYVGVKLGSIKFRDLTYALAETMYSYPFHIPSNFTFIIRALTTIEGIGLLVEPKFSFFDAARPHAKEFMLKRESAHLRNQILGKLIRGEEGKISWTKVWNLAKLAYRTYFNRAPSNPDGVS
ncbi:MAG: AarF/ABC1/UbiB kinase family protein [Blastocatellia bacterium]|nr:AarF/ABC1/UbiB kinase family protein [Blastocatellia bacterium]